VIKIKKDELAGGVAHVEKKRNACRVLMVKPEEERPLGRPPAYRGG
jgi:hypothetical protein